MERGFADQSQCRLLSPPQPKHLEVNPVAVSHTL
jgi:hypothetical protein